MGNLFKIKNSLRNWYLREQFQPSLWSIFFNANYFSKGRLNKYVAMNAHHMKGRLLDFGCGQKPYRALMKVDEYVGMDLGVTSEGNKSRNVDIFYDGKSIPCADESFDSLFSSEVLEHVFNLDEMLVEIRRVLKTGGKLLVTIPFARREHDIPYDYARYTSFGFKALLERHGFELLEFKKTSNSVESVFLMWNQYLYNSVFPRSNILKLFLSVIFIFPSNLLAIILSAVLPNNDDLFLNSVVVARKKVRKE